MMNCHLKVGDGRRINFWTDIWCQAASFKDLFPSLYRLSLEKSVSLRTIYDRKALSGEWNLAFRRRLYDWEEVDLARLLNHLMLGLKVRSRHIIDKIVWSASPCGELSVSSVYKSVVNSLGPSLKISKLVWLNYIPP